MIEDRKELESLRLSLARVAQALSVETDELKVRGKSYNELLLLAMFNDRGWNQLAESCAYRALELDSQGAR